MRIKTCPSCGSSRVNLYMGGQTGIQYKCEDCGYIGALVVEREVKQR